MNAIGVPLSVLDLVPVSEGDGAQAALAHTTELARCADRWGYHRYWVAEHHSFASAASPSPAVLLAHLGGVTSRIRLGSGGVMLTNHPPMLVAEQFGLLGLLHPGRIDLGVGRASGAVPAVAQALRREENPGPADYENRVTELLGFLGRGFPDDHLYTESHVRAVPHADGLPVWILGQSSSADVAARFGLPFAARYQAESTSSALRKYRADFQPSERLARPHTMVSVTVVCADTDEEALLLAITGSLMLSWLGTKKEAPLPTPESVAGYLYSPQERDFVDTHLKTVIRGTPAKVRAGLAQLLEQTLADELMINTLVHGNAGRLRSYELTAQACDLA